MSSDDAEGFDLASAIESGADAVATIRTALGIEREQYRCDHCGAACEPTTTYNYRTAAFDGGKCPAWECPDCGAQFHREADDAVHTMDLYDRG